MPQKFRFNVPKKQKKYYSGKRKCHSVKVQAVMHYKTGQILSTHLANGSVHDFKLFTRSMRSFTYRPYILADKGYQGLKGLGFSCLLPLKAKKREKLARELRPLNKEINKRRVCIEHLFGNLKRFKILSTTYRNRRSRLGLRFNLLAAIYNLELNQ